MGQEEFLVATVVSGVEGFVRLEIDAQDQQRQDYPVDIGNSMVVGSGQRSV